MATPKTPPTLTSPLILQQPDGRWAILFDAAQAAAMPPAKKVKPEGTTYTVVGYRQTVEPAVRGGKANRQAIRFRNGGLRALARTFRGQPFLTAHNWSDARARGGTVLDAWVEEVEGELLMLFELQDPSRPAPAAGSAPASSAPIRTVIATRWSPRTTAATGSACAATSSRSCRDSAIAR